MEKNIEVSLLFDFYGELLKPSGRQAIDLYYNEDLSLAEIADQSGITRQGVRDSVIIELTGQRPQRIAYLCAPLDAGFQRSVQGFSERKHLGRTAGASA